MSKLHQKKRNAGLLYEFLVHCISRSLVENDQKKSTTALKILRKYFRPGTELHKEFRLINALIKTTVSSELVASSIITEAKNAARLHNIKELDREKSLLIRNINHIINDENFYDQQINEYKMYATVQTLINDWRDDNRDLGRLALYEDQLNKWLVTEKQKQIDHTITEASPGTSRLLMKVMMKKLNEKYSGSLSPEQKSIIKSYAFATTLEDSSTIKKKLSETRENLLLLISNYEKENSVNEFMNKKMSEVRDQLINESLENIDDVVVSRFMLYTKLNEELDVQEE